MVLVQFLHADPWRTRPYRPLLFDRSAGNGYVLPDRLDESRAHVGPGCRVLQVAQADGKEYQQQIPVSAFSVGRDHSVRRGYTWCKEQKRRKTNPPFPLTHIL